MRTRRVHAARSSSGIRRATRRLTVVAPILAALLIGGAGVGAQAAFADTDDGNLTVDVTDGVEPSATPSPRPSASATRAPSIPPRTGNGPAVTAAVTQATIADPVAADEALDDGIAVGSLAVSGLSATASPSFAVGNGTLVLSFVVRNSSEEEVDATADFWVEDAFSRRIAVIDSVDVDDLEVDETRRVLVRIDGLGQQAILRNFVTFTPPKTVDGEPTAPVTRDTTIFVAPLFSISMLSAIGALSAVAWWAFSRRGVGLGLRRFGL